MTLPGETLKSFLALESFRSCYKTEPYKKVVFTREQEGE